MNRGRAAWCSLPLLGAALTLSLVWAVTFGTVEISPGDVYGVVLRALFGAGDAAYGAGRVHDVVWLIRLPRLVLAVGVGACLSVSGLVMQALLRNPMAEPYVLGISSGAYAGATLSILMGVGLGGGATGVTAFFGALGACGAVMALARVGGRAGAVKLILVGTAVSALCAAFSNFIIYLAGDRNRVQALVHWTMGSLAGATWPGNGRVLLVAALGTLFFLGGYRALNLMLLGDDAATTLGVNIHRRRFLYLPVCALLVGTAVNAAGMIGFVGLVVPHALRLLFGSDHKKLIPLCAVTGGLFLVWADVACRTLLAGAELPIGIVTALIGAPCFITLIARKKYGFGGEG
jgi:iron complex transport system permease protein